MNNFRYLSGERKFVVPLVKGLVLLQGPSGSGKSSLISAIAWAVSGKTADGSCTWGQKKMTCTLRWSPAHPVLASLASLHRCNTPRTFRLVFLDGSTKQNDEADAWLAEQVGNNAGQLCCLSQKLKGVWRHFLDMTQAEKSAFLQELMLADEAHMAMVTALRAWCKDQSQKQAVSLASANTQVATMGGMLQDLKGKEPSGDAPGQTAASDDAAARIRALEHKQREDAAYRRAQSRLADAVARLRALFEGSAVTEYARQLMPPFGEWVPDWTNPTADLVPMLDDLDNIIAEQGHTAAEMELLAAVDAERQARQLAVAAARSRAAAQGGVDVAAEATLLAQLEAQLREAEAADQALRKAEHALKADRRAAGADAQVLEAARRVAAAHLLVECPGCRCTLEYDSAGAQRWVVVASLAAGSKSVVDPKAFAQFLEDKERSRAVSDRRAQLQQALAEAAGAAGAGSGRGGSEEKLVALKGAVQAKKRLVADAAAAAAALAAAEAAAAQWENPSVQSKHPAVSRWAKQPRDRALEAEYRHSPEQHRHAAGCYTQLLAQLKALPDAPRLPAPEPFGDDDAAEMRRLEAVLAQADLASKLAQWEAKLAAQRGAAQSALEKLEAAKVLERLTREVELQSLESYLLPLNTVLQQLLDEVLFQDAGEVQCQFEVSKVGVGKPEVLMALYVRGHACDEKGLSGGQLDRLALGISVCMYRLFASKLGLLCLDESLSSLDPATCGEILTALHETKSFLPGLTLVVDHHGLEGVFDYVLRVKPSS